MSRQTFDECGNNGSVFGNALFKIQHSLDARCVDSNGDDDTNVPPSPLGTIDQDTEPLNIIEADGFAAVRAAPGFSRPTFWRGCTLLLTRLACDSFHPRSGRPWATRGDAENSDPADGEDSEGQADSGRPHKTSTSSAMASRSAARTLCRSSWWNTNSRLLFLRLARRPLSIFRGKQWLIGFGFERPHAGARGQPATNQF